MVLAAKDDAAAARDSVAPRDQMALAGEVADLLYHTLVLMAGGLAVRVIAVRRGTHHRPQSRRFPSPRLPPAPRVGI